MVLSVVDMELSRLSIELLWVAWRLDMLPPRVVEVMVTHLNQGQWEVDIHQCSSQIIARSSLGAKSLILQEQITYRNTGAKFEHHISTYGSLYLMLILLIWQFIIPLAHRDTRIMTSLFVTRQTYLCRSGWLRRSDQWTLPPPTIGADITVEIPTVYWLFTLSLASTCTGMRTLRLCMQDMQPSRANPTLETGVLRSHSSIVIGI